MKKLLATLLAVLALCGCMAVGALAVAEENELAWSQAPLLLTSPRRLLRREEIMLSQSLCEAL